MGQHILIVDDDPTQRRLLDSVIAKQGHKTVLAGGGAEAMAVLNGPKGSQIGLVLLDLVMPDMDGLAVLTEIKPVRPDLPVIVLTAKGGIDTVVSAMRAGADDFMVKPASPERIQVSIQNAMKLTALSSEITRLTKKQKGKLTFDDIIAHSAAMQQVIRLGRRAAASTIPIQIEGESGVGKEVIARAIQGESERAGKPFVTVNCGAIPDNLVESILFGHEKGAFTGASDKHVGKFVEANGGTLFLDEIGELRLDLQVKLLRALQEGEVDPVGAKKPVKVDIRFISATNRDLLAMVRDGDFREDLYYRLNVFPIEIPALRERVEDIPELANHFVRRFAVEEGKKVAAIAPDAMDMLASYSWPGNVRQLENAVFRAVVLSDAERLTVADFPQIAQFSGRPVPAPAAAPASPAQDVPAEHTPAATPAMERLSEVQAETRAQLARETGMGSGEGAGQANGPVTGGDTLADLRPQRRGPEPVTPYSPDAIGEPVLDKPLEAGSASGPTLNGDGIPITDDAGHMRRLEDIESEMIRRAIDRYAGHMSEVARRLGIGRSTLYRKVRELGLEVRATGTD